MRTLDDFRKDVEEVEGGKYPSRFHNRDEAREALVDEICRNPWRTAAERDGAQVLVVRLARLRGSSAAPVSAAVERARSVEDMLQRWRRKSRQEPQAGERSPP